MLHHKFTKYDLFKSLEDLRLYFNKPNSELLYEISVEIIVNFLGFQWAINNIFGFNPLDNYLYSKSNTKQEMYKHQDRVISLADMLFSLQHTLGFENKLKELKTSSVESAVAEFEGAKFLHKMDIPFKFVVPKGKKGNDYDVEIFFDKKSTIPCDIKCKFENTILSENTILNTLKKAKKQLPKNSTGMIFVKIPENWIRENNLFDIINSALNNFFRDTNRVALIFFHWEEWKFFPRIKYATRGAKFNYFSNEFLKYDNYVFKDLVNRLAGIYLINKWNHLVEIIK